MIIDNAEPYTIITVYDNPDGHKDDDYTQIKVRRSIENFQIGKSVFQPYGSIPDFLEKTTEPSILPPLRPNSADFEGRHIFISLNQ